MGHQNGFGVELPSFAWNNCRKSGLDRWFLFLCDLVGRRTLMGHQNGFGVELPSFAWNNCRKSRQLLNGVHFDENKKKSFVIVL